MIVNRVSSSVQRHKKAPRLALLCLTGDNLKDTRNVCGNNIERKARLVWLDFNRFVERDDISLIYINSCSSICL